jgi:hypothetical protein
MISQIALVVAVTGLSSGCQQKLTKKARAGINSVSINTEVSLPERLYVGSKGSVGGGTGWFGAVTFAAGIADIPRKIRQSRTISNLMKKNNIVPGRILAMQFKEQLEKEQVFPSIVETDGDATFTFEISSYGLQSYSIGRFWPPYPLRSELTVDVFLKKPDGTLVWKNWAKTYTAHLLPGTNGVDAYMYNEYIQNPNLLQKGFEQAASKVVDEFFKNIEVN